MSRIRVSLAVATFVAGAIALTAASHAQCIPDNFPNDWLQQQENAGGHTIAKHVGQSDQQLMDRVNGRRGPRAAGSFPASDPPAANYTAAQTTITQALALANQRNALNVWATGADEGDRRSVAVNAGGTIGRVVTRQAPANVFNTPYFCMVFEANGDTTCYLLTAFPTPAANGYCN